MRTIATIGMVLAAGAGLIAATSGAVGGASGGSDPAPRDQRLVVLPTSANAGAALQLASFGIAELTTDDGTAIPALHVRAVIANPTRDQPWALDASKARLEATTIAAVAPAFVNSDLPTLPVAIVDPGERRMIDLYFPVPAELATSGGPTSFALTWPFSTPARVVRYAWFERDAAIPQSGGDVAPAGWARHWWFDPKYAWPTHFHGPGIATPRPPSHVRVTKAPRWDASVAVDRDDERPRETECREW